MNKNKMELEDAIKYLKNIKDEDLWIRGYVYGTEAIETVLQALENSNIKDVNNITATQYAFIQREGYLRGRKEEQEKTREYILGLQENSIPKKKIEDKIKYYISKRDEYEKSTHSCEFSIRMPALQGMNECINKIKVLQELLEDK